MTAANREPPHSRNAPPWCDCGPVGAPGFGAVYAWRGAGGALAFTFDRHGVHHALTLFDCPAPAPEVVIHGRRFDVVFDARFTPVIL